MVFKQAPEVNDSMDRRRFLFAAVGILFGGRANAFQVGLSASPLLMDKVLPLSCVREGSGNRTLYIAFTPWCHLSPYVYEVTRPYIDRIQIAWIPFSGGQPEGRQGTEFLLRSGAPSDVPACFEPPGTPARYEATPLADHQDALFDQVQKEYVRNFARYPGSPTLFYTIGNRTMAVPGAPISADMAELARNLSAV